MSSKIFKAIWIAAITVFLASLLLIMGTLYDYFSSLQRNQLRNQTELAAQGVAMSGMDYLDELSIENYRITWVSPDGNVLFDNEADTASMQNHLERPEIQQALKEGFGESTRHSYTLADQQYYAAKRLPPSLRLCSTDMFCHPCRIDPFICSGVPDRQKDRQTHQ